MAKRKMQEVWVSIKTATTEQMARAIGQEREKICKQLRQMQNDVDWFNENRADEAGGKLHLVLLEYCEQLERQLQETQIVVRKM